MKEFVDYCLFIGKFFVVCFAVWFVVATSLLTEEPIVLILTLVLIILIRVRARTQSQDMQNDH
jgi:hypothetical protein